jgi:GNAT superfamily N-acetyltransferase
VLTLVRVTDEWPEALDALISVAETEGYHHLTRLRLEWQNGTERFTSDGCVLLTGYVPTYTGIPALAAVGGVTRDPIIQDALRMRRFYVSPYNRRSGLGTHLAAALMHEALATKAPLTLHTTEARAIKFWENLGFVRLEGENPTHRYMLPNPVTKT